MKLKIAQSVSNVESFEDLRRFTDQTLKSIADVINGNIDFSDNVSVSFATVTFDRNDVTYQVNHTLNRMPVGYVPVSKSIASDLYTGSGSFTTKTIPLKATIAGVTMKVMVF